MVKERNDSIFASDLDHYLDLLDARNVIFKDK